MNKKELKAQLTNEIAKRFSNKIKEFEKSIQINKANYHLLWEQYIELQEENRNLKEENESLKDWNTRLMEFMDMTSEDRKTYIENLKACQQFNSQMINLSRMMSIFGY